LNLRRVQAQDATGLRRAGSFLCQVELEAVLLGGRVASRVRPRMLAQGFALLLVAVALYTAAHSIPQLV